MVTPTIGRPVTLAELDAEPVQRNSELGYYTNFMNLLDYAAIAVPSGFMDNGLPWGLTLFGRAFTDQYLLSLADGLQRQQGWWHRHRRLLRAMTGRGWWSVARTPGWPGVELAAQAARRARWKARSAHPTINFVCLGRWPAVRPGMVRVKDGGVAIAVEVWELPGKWQNYGSFLTGIPAPLGLGKVQLADGRWESGFICEAYGLEGRWISTTGGWRAYLQSRT